MRKLAIAVLTAALLLLLPSAASAFTYYGTDGQDSFNGTEENDVFWTYAGQDDAYGHEGSDDLHMGDGRDFGSGGDDTDDLYGGDYPGTGAFEVMKGQGAADDLFDSAGSGIGNGDLDEMCGGPGEDYANIQDDDSSDHFASGPGVDDYSKDFLDAVSNLDC